MSIFFELVKEYMLEEIEHIRNESIKSDNSITNKGLSFIGMGRDKELSNKKQNITNDLLSDIKNLSFLDNVSDEEIKSTITDMIEASKIKASNESKKKGYNNNGKTGERLEKAIIMVNDIYAKLDEINIIDFNNEEDPYYQFAFYGAKYLVQKIYDLRHQNVIQAISNDPKISSIVALADEKEALVIEALGKFIPSNEELEPYDKLKRSNDVKKCLETLIKDNKDLCNSHAYKYNVPIQLSLLGVLKVNLPTFGPKPGFLKECMKKALNEIDNLIFQDANMGIINI